MVDSNKYLTSKDVTEPMLCTIVLVRKEIVDGRPRLVLYFKNQTRGLLLTREIARDITAILGPHPMVEEFFSSPEGQLQ